MIIYVGRWGLLPEELEGINGLYDMSEDEVRAEIARQIEEWAEDHTYEDNLMGAYTPAEFEEEFNANETSFNGGTYFIKFFDDGKSVLQD